jgi:hypothetical protein
MGVVDPSVCRDGEAIDAQALMRFSDGSRTSSMSGGIVMIVFAIDLSLPKKPNHRLARAK